MKARWALDHYGIPYRSLAYTPGIGEPWLRWKINKWSGRVAVPVLVTPTETLCDSFAIAQWADAYSKQPEFHNLFPDNHADTIASWNKRCDQLMAFDRNRFVQNVPKTPELKRQMAPSVLLWLPFRSYIAEAAGGIAMTQFLNKWKDVADVTNLDQARSTLQQLRAALASNNGSYILGTFSFADVVMAVAVYVLCPPGGKFTVIAKGLPTTSPDLYDEFKDLIPWADSVFDKWCPESTSSVHCSNTWKQAH
ncbi:hypothetical protein WJX77_012448 [Trebouxia sp. C0004]